MINKKLLHFKSKEAFERELSNNNILNTSIAFIQDTQEIWTHGYYYATQLGVQEIESIVIESKNIQEALEQIIIDKIPIITDGDGLRFLANDGTYKNIEAKFIKFTSNNLLKFYCIEPVEVVINEESTLYPANSSVSITLQTEDEWYINPTSNNSITILESWPGALGFFYPWLEGVQLFSGIVFDMNDLGMYEKWNQGHQGDYHVQFAQYSNCIFWSDNPYISDLNKRTNYTLYYSSQLPLCYSTIPENTFKAFYLAYNVTSDPNWSNPVYRASFAQANWATQVFSYYGLHSIGMFNMDGSLWNIVLPKDCRGLCYSAPNIRNLGVLDAMYVTNFGAKSGSWRDAFGYCYCLENLYIKNLKVNINVSWSPISQQSLEFILHNAANTNTITITLSPYTYLRLTDSNKELAANKNIFLELNESNSQDIITYKQKQYIENLDTWDWAEL